MNFPTDPTRSLLLGLALIAAAAPTLAQPEPPRAPPNVQTVNKGMAVAYPWVFKNGTDTSRATAIKTAEEVARKAGYATIPGDVAEAAWASKKLGNTTFGKMPTARTLKAFGKATNAARVIYGSVSWHTRSIWVNAGPKTISTATVNAYVFDVASNKVVFRKTGVVGRSDEKSSGYKIAAAVLLTPLVTAVSGGPATPREQRAVQIALGLAYSNWVMPARTKAVSR